MWDTMRLSPWLHRRDAFLMVTAHVIGPAANLPIGNMLGSDKNQECEQDIPRPLMVEPRVLASRVEDDPHPIIDDFDRFRCRLCRRCQHRGTRRLGPSGPSLRHHCPAKATGPPPVSVMQLVVSAPYPQLPFVVAVGRHQTAPRAKGIGDRLGSRVYHGSTCAPVWQLFDTVAEAPYQKTPLFTAY